MADHPILFSAPMIHAILREIDAPGTGKTQTRRIITPQTFKLLGRDYKFHRPDAEFLASALHGARDFRWIEGAFSWLAEPCGVNSMAVAVQGRGKPKYAPGDRLWCREAWHAARCLDRTPPRDIPRDADIEHAATARSYAEIGLKGKLRPGMFLPRWASRLALYVTEVRVERLQDISEANALAEGICIDTSLPEDMHRCWLDMDPATKGADWLTSWDAKDVYRQLWHHLHRLGAWEANPWVSVTTFRPVLGNIDSLPATLQGVA